MRSSRQRERQPDSTWFVLIWEGGGERVCRSSGFEPRARGVVSMVQCPGIGVCLHPIKRQWGGGRAEAGCGAAPRALGGRRPQSPLPLSLPYPHPPPSRPPSPSQPPSPLQRLPARLVDECVVGRPHALQEEVVPRQALPVALRRRGGVGWGSLQGRRACVHRRGGGWRLAVPALPRPPSPGAARRPLPRAPRHSLPNRPAAPALACSKNMETGSRRLSTCARR